MDTLTLHSLEKYVPIEEFYAGKSVFITGGTGFLGKALIEKLLYSCPNLTNVYILLREKKNVPPHERLKNMLDSEVFSRIKSEKPESFAKMIPITGDVTLPDLGMTEKDKILLHDTVSVVFHLAATVKFNVALSDAMTINVEGTRAVIGFSKQIKNLQAFLYMSTAFSQTNQAILEEIVYPTPMAIDRVYEVLKQHGNDKSRDQEITKDRPNNYTFTKALTEALVAEIHGDMPTVIMRPSIVVAAMQEPIPGWIDTWHGPTPILDLAARGWIRCFYGHKDYAVDLIPLDYVVNATIVTAARCQRSKKVAVYNCCTSAINKLPVKDMYTLYTRESERKGYNNLPLTSMIFTECLLISGLIAAKFQMIPAYVLDLVFNIQGKPTNYVKMQKKLAVYQKIGRFISARSWLMLATRLRDLAEDLDPRDQLKFPCNPARISWPEFMPIYFNGVLKFLIKDT